MQELTLPTGGLFTRPVEIHGNGGSGGSGRFCVVSYVGEEIPASYLYGDLFCWGNTQGLGFGEGAPQTYETPTKTPAPKAVVDLTIGRSMSCVISVGGTIYCTGLNNYGELGDGTTASSRDWEENVLVNDVGTIKDMAAGQNFVCALNTDDEVWCMGFNGHGELGNGSFEDETDEYVQVVVASPGLADFTALDEISAAANHICAYGYSPYGSAARCWGQSWQAGELGNGYVGGNSANQNMPQCQAPEWWAVGSLCN